MSKEICHGEKKNLNNIGISSALLAAFAWGATGILVRFLSDFSLWSIVAGRCFIALLGTSLLFLLINRKISFFQVLQSRLSWSLGILMISYYILAVSAYQFAPVAEVSILISTSPLFTLGYRVTRGMPTPYSKFVGAFISILGVILVVGPGPKTFSVHSSLLQRLSGDSMALLAGAIMSTYSLLYRNTKKNTPSSQSVTFLTFLIGTICLIGWLIFTNSFPTIKNLTNGKNLLLFIGLGLGATVLPTFCYSLASQKLPSVVVTSTRLLTPLISTLLAIFFLHEFPGILFWPGAICILIGLYAISK